MRRIFVCLIVLSLALSAQQKKIVVTGLTPAAVDELRKSSPGANIVFAASVADAEAQIGDADAIMGTITPEMVRKGKNLKWFQIYSAGLETFLHLAPPDLKRSNITVTNCKIIQGPEIADHAMALLLTLTRGLNRAVADRTKEEWTPSAFEPIELRGKTAVIIGLGGIGTQIATRASGFGMTIIGVDPKDIPFLPFVQKVVKPDHLNDVLPLADVVFISAPHTPETTGMMGPKQFELLKKNAYFIAVSRGAIYDMPSLVKALDSRKVAGAGVDVTNPEPLPKGHPLWKFENAIITPHIATKSDGLQARRMEVLKDNINRFVNGQPLVNVIDKEKGY